MLERRYQIQNEQPMLVPSLQWHLRQWLSEQNFKVVGFYRPIRAEPDITQILLEWVSQQKGRQLCVPVIDDASSRRMHYSVWNPEYVRTRMFGIEEPEKDVPIKPDVIFSPCVGITQDGFRLGNGGGFFDCWLTVQKKRRCDVIAVAVAFECLWIDEFTPQTFDMPMDWILTESGIRNAKQKGGDCTVSTL